MMNPSTTTIEPVLAGRVDLQSRVGARAVAGGTLVALALYAVLMEVAGAFGLWSVDIFSTPLMMAVATGLLMWTVVAWVGALFVGAGVAAIIGKPRSLFDGVVTGVVTWASTLIVGGILMAALVMGAVAVGITSAGTVAGLVNEGVLWTFFIGDALALVGAGLGGALGSQWEQLYKKPAERVSHVPAPMVPGSRASAAI
jgi:hypothetical protein